MERDTVRKEYSNGEVTVVWQPNLCVHSTICWKTATGMPQVFNPRVRPWVNVEGADTARIIAQVKKCPSGALSFYYNNMPKPDKEHAAPNTVTHIEVQHNGPLLIYGSIEVKDQRGNVVQKQNATAFCRCGQSSNKPYCDGTHVNARIDD